jgi:mannosyl-3-phosphoglycerate phosphatase
MKKTVIFTDLDASLLDYDTYEFGEIKNFVINLIENGIFIIPVTSKTKNETLKFLKSLPRYESFAIENGGAVYLIDEYEKYTEEKLEIESDNGLLKKVLGTKIDILKDFLKEFSEKENLMIKTIFDFSVSELSFMLNLSAKDLIDTLDREYDIPFIIENPIKDKIEKLIENANKKRYKIHIGGRFYHISGNYNKGDAVRFLEDIYKNRFGDIMTIGIGDSLNDLSLLESVEIPILIRKKDFTICEEIKEKISNLYITNKPAPLGWQEGVEKVLKISQMR